MNQLLFFPAVLLFIGGIAILAYASAKLALALGARRRAKSATGVSASGVAALAEVAFPRSLLSNEALVFRKVQVQEEVSGGRGGTVLSAIFTHESSAPFFMTIRGTDVLVDPAVADRVPQTDRMKANAMSEGKRASVLDALRALGYGGNLDRDDLVVTEETIPAEHLIFVVGQVRGQLDQGGGAYRKSTPPTMEGGALLGVGALSGYLVFMGLGMVLGAGLVALGVAMGLPLFHELRERGFL